MTARAACPTPAASADASTASSTVLQVEATFGATPAAQRLRARMPVTGTLLGRDAVRSTLLTSRLAAITTSHCHRPRRGDIGYQSTTGRLLLYGDDEPCAAGIELVGRVVSNLDALTTAPHGTLLQIGEALPIPSPPITDR